ncbi:MAG: hypothetical protein GY847_35825 [Proteobacteria bacterium]|nr:hypothetical protein [Pseudomonadota bacterium]
MKTILFIIVWIEFCIVIVIPWRSAAEPPPSKILVISSEDDTGRLQELCSALDAHLSDFKTEVKPHTVDVLPQNPDEQVELAQQTSLTSGAFAAVWLDMRRDLVLILAIPRHTNQENLELKQIIGRPIPKAGRDKSIVYDSIAAFVRSVLYSRLNQIEQPLPGSDSNKPRQIIDGETPWILDDEVPLKTVKDDSIRSRTLPSITFTITGGYSPLFVPGANTMQHGAHIEYGLMIGPYVEGGMGIDLLPHIDLGSGISLTRQLLRFSVLGHIKFSAIHVGLRASLVLDFIGVRGTLDNMVINDNKRKSVGISPALVVRYQVYGILSIFTEMGIDIYSHNRIFKYGESGTVVIDLNAIQPRGIIGAVLQFRMDQGE